MQTQGQEKMRHVSFIHLPFSSPTVHHSPVCRCSPDTGFPAMRSPVHEERRGGHGACGFWCHRVSVCPGQAYPLPSPHRCRLLSRTGLKEINKSREKMRCKKKTESIIPSKLKVLGRGWQETEGGRWSLGWTRGDPGGRRPPVSHFASPRPPLETHTHPNRLWR